LGIVPRAKGTEAARIPEYAEAAYNYVDHTLWFRRDTYGSSPEERASIVHECTHALRHLISVTKDLYGRDNLKDQDSHDNEVVAYIAEALFYFYETGKLREDAEEKPEYAIHSAATVVADHIKNNRGAHVSEQDRMNVKTTIASDWRYMFKAGEDKSDRAKSW
jgi:hypothetical protein